MSILTLNDSNRSIDLLSQDPLGVDFSVKNAEGKEIDIFLYAQNPQKTFNIFKHRKFRTISIRYEGINLKDFYINKKFLATSLGLSEKVIKTAKNANYLSQLVYSHQTLLANKDSETRQKILDFVNEFGCAQMFFTLQTLAEKLNNKKGFNPLTKLVNHPAFQNKKAKQALIAIGKIFCERIELKMKQRSLSNIHKDPTCKRLGYIFFTNKKGEEEIYLNTNVVLGEGQFKVVQEAIRLNDLKPYALIYAKEREFSSIGDIKKDIKVLNELNQLNVPHVNKPYKVVTTLECEDELLEYVLLQKKMDDNLLGLSKTNSQTFLEGLIQVLESVVKMHQHNYYHCDIKPDNILIEFAKNENGSFQTEVSQTPDLKNKEFKILKSLAIIDFGLVFNRKKDRWTPRGTPFYFSPELRKSSNNYTGVDSFALGVTFFELLYSDLLQLEDFSWASLDQEQKRECFSTIQQKILLNETDDSFKKLKLQLLVIIAHLLETETGNRWTPKQALDALNKIKALY